mmetsp:Transcript_36755/g.58844  ORF Transcript_36755/g.58844 Transcript_36755/m.58844 type:complete len:840 (-) Transcript_36755:78-2597(-)
MSGYFSGAGSCLVEARNGFQPNGAPSVPMMPRLDIDRSHLALDPAGGYAPKIPSLSAGGAEHSRIGGTPGSDRRRLPEPMVAQQMFADNFYGTSSSPDASRQLSPRERVAGRADVEDRGRIGFGYPGNQRSSSMPPIRTLPTVPFATFSPPPVPFVAHNIVSPLAFAPPLPPVRPELLARLNALEKSLQQQDAQQSDLALSQLLREELWAAQESERRARSDMDMQLRKLVSENEMLRQEIQALKLKNQITTREPIDVKVSKDIDDLVAAKDAERRGREELDLRHMDVLRAHKRLQDDYTKLQADFREEQEAHKSALQIHQVVNADADRLRDDLRKQQQAHAQELNSAWRDKDEAHRKAEEATSKVMRDFQKMEADRQKEQRAREEAEEKVKKISDDMAQLRSDIERANVARENELKAKEELERLHREVQLDNQRLREDRAKQVGNLEVTRVDLQSKNEELSDQIRLLRTQMAEVKRNAERVSTLDVQQTVFKLENECDDLRNENERLKKAEAEIKLEVRTLRDRVRDTDNANFSFRRMQSEKELLEKDLETLRSALREREESEKLLRTDLRTVNQNRDSDAQVLRRELLEEQSNSLNLQEERDRALRDIEHLKKASEERERQAQNLRAAQEEVKAERDEAFRERDLAKRDVEFLKKANEERELQAQKLRDAQDEFETGVVKEYEKVQQDALAETLRTANNGRSFSATTSLNSRRDSEADRKNSLPMTAASSVSTMKSEFYDEVSSLGGYARYSQARIFDVTGSEAEVEETATEEEEDDEGGATLMVDLTNSDDEADMQVITPSPRGSTVRNSPRGSMLGVSRASQQGIPRASQLSVRWA